MASIALLAITGLAAVLRLWNSAEQSLRLDEGFTIRAAALPLHPVRQGGSLYLPSLLQNVASDVHPPGYFLLVHVWMQLFGADLSVIRLPSEIAGILAVPAVYLLAQSLYGRAVGLLAALIAACSPIWIWHAQEARMYTFLVLFTVLSTYGVVLAVEHRRAIGWPIFIVAGILAIYTQYYAFLILAAQGLWVLSRCRRLGVRGLGMYALSLLAMATTYVPWLLLLHANYHGASDPNLTAPNLYTPLIMLSDFLFGYLSVPATSNVVAAWPLLVPILLAVGAWGRHMSSRGLLLWLLFLLPIVASFAVTLTLRPVLSERYLLVSTPALYILLAVVLVEVRGRLSRLALIVSILGISLLSWRVEEVSAGNAEAQNYRQPVQYIENHIQPGDVVALDAYFNQDAYSYYSHLNVPVYDLPAPTPGRVAPTSAALATYLHGIEAGRQRLWVLYYLETDSDPHNLVRHYLDYHTAGHRVVYGGPFRRDDTHFPGSYRNVQLVLYRLVNTPAAVQQTRPETMQELRALTHISPTVRAPFAPAFGRPGDSAPMVGPLLAVPRPRGAWHMLRSASPNAPTFVTLFNPNTQPVDARITFPGGERVVRVSAASDLDIDLARWSSTGTNIALSVRATAPVVVMRTIFARGGEQVSNALAGGGHIGAAAVVARQPREAWQFGPLNVAADGIELTLYNPGSTLAHVRVSTAAGARALQIPVQSGLQLDLTQWSRAAATGALHIASNVALVTKRSQVVGGGTVQTANGVLVRGTPAASGFAAPARAWTFPAVPLQGRTDLILTNPNRVPATISVGTANGTYQQSARVLSGGNADMQLHPFGAVQSLPGLRIRAAVPFVPVRATTLQPGVVLFSYGHSIAPSGYATGPGATPNQ